MTPVNAIAVAQARGLHVQEKSQPQAKDFTALVEISAAAAQGGRSLAGTVYGRGDLRLVRIDNLPVDLIPEGNLLVMQNNDKPGVVGHTGTVLSQAGVNIAGLQVGRNRPGGVAISLWNVDGQVSADVLAKVKNHPAIIAVQMVTL